jgi:hypothetical protein
LTVRDTVASAAADHYVCVTEAWSGTKPTSPQAALQTAKAGNGAQFGIEAWTPNESSPYVKQWPNEYDRLTGGFDKHALTFPGLFANAGWPAKWFNPSHLGYQTRGIVVQVQGLAKGLVAAAGCWWNDKALSAVCIVDEEAIGKPVVKHLNQLAAIAAPKILG